MSSRLGGLGGWIRKRRKAWSMIITDNDLISADRENGREGTRTPDQLRVKQWP